MWGDTLKACFRPTYASLSPALALAALVAACTQQPNLPAQPSYCEPIAVGSQQEIRTAATGLPANYRLSRTESSRYEITVFAEFGNDSRSSDLRAKTSQ